MPVATSDRNLTVSIFASVQILRKPTCTEVQMCVKNRGQQIPLSSTFCQWVRTSLKKRKKSKSGTAPYPRGASASAPPKGRKEGGQRRATRDQGGNERGLKQLCTRPAANTRSPEKMRSSYWWTLSICLSGLIFLKTETKHSQQHRE
jgi:hypothetical protein